MAAALCRRGSPVVEGRSSPQVWGAAVVATVGFVNFLGDPSFPPVRTLAQVARGFGVSESSLQAKKRVLCDRFDLMPFHPRWTLPRLMAQNPLLWLLETTEGLLVGIRMRPRAEQLQAFEAGLIPYVPADRPQVRAEEPRDDAPLFGQGFG